MKEVAKYNLFKGLSTLCTIGTPIITLLCCGDFLVENSKTSISAAGVFVILLMALFCKDKLAENFKMPSAFILCLIVLILIWLIESILVPIKTVCISTMITSGIDEVSFKRLYKDIEKSLPENTSSYKHIGFIFTTTNKLKGGDVNGR